MESAEIRKLLNRVSNKEVWVFDRCRFALEKALKSISSGEQNDLSPKEIADEALALQDGFFKEYRAECDYVDSLFLVLKEGDRVKCSVKIDGESQGVVESTVVSVGSTEDCSKCYQKITCRLDSGKEFTTDVMYLDAA